MAERPYFSLGIESLEALANAARGNAMALAALKRELEFRRRPRARKLLAQVAAYMAELEQGCGIDLRKKPE